MLHVKVYFLSLQISYSQRQCTHPLYVHSLIYTADTSNSPECETLLQCTPVLRLAVKDHLCLLSGHLLSRRLISTEQEAELRNEMHTELKRAASLVAMLLNKVKVNPSCYHTFIEVLEGCGDNFVDIVKHLKDTHKSLTSGIYHCQLV